MRSFLILFFMTISVHAVAVADERVETEVVFLNASSASFEAGEGCEQWFLAWLSQPLTKPIPGGRTPSFDYALVIFESEDRNKCISREQAEGGAVIRVTLEPDNSCSGFSDGLGTYGVAEQECVDEHGYASDCWEEKSDCEPLSSGGLTLEEIEQIGYLACFRLLINPFARVD